MSRKHRSSRVGRTITTPEVPLRLLAEHAGMSATEVADALEDLMDRGYVTALSMNPCHDAIAWAVHTPGGDA
ncbi:hypothetical protein [Kocuria kalidii]|uniref:hypothetical protein n=1 Tax=Kocuria kalidii TaxID=3376283 RepID=UPI0037A30D69